MDIDWYLILRTLVAFYATGYLTILAIRLKHKWARVYMFIAASPLWILLVLFALDLLGVIQNYRTYSPSVGLIFIVSPVLAAQAILTEQANLRIEKGRNGTHA